MTVPWLWIAVGLALWVGLLGLGWAFVHGGTKPPTPKSGQLRPVTDEREEGEQDD